MTQPYRLNKPSGIKVEATGQIIHPGEDGWAEYLAWFAEQPGPAFPGGPVPAGTGLLPFEEPPQALADLRTEALARLYAVLSDKRSVATMVAVGHVWRLTVPFTLAVLVHRAAMPPVPSGFSLPDADGNQVTLGSAQLSELVEGISAYLIAVNVRYSALVADINASTDPLTVDLAAGWPSGGEP